MFFLMYMGIGIIAGFTGGLLGVGGGAVTVPLLLWVFAAQGFSEEVATHLAIATSLGAMIVTAASSTITHAKRGAVLWRVFAMLACGVFLGTSLGVASAVNVAGNVLQMAFAVFLLLISLQMIRGFSVKQHRSLPGVPALLGAGGIIGWVSMFFGIGGGSLTVPFLSWCGVVSQRAVATSAALGLPIAAWGAVMYAWSGWGVAGMPEGAYGYVYLPAVIGIALTSILFANLGARLAHKLRADHLRKVFGIVLLFVAGELLWKNL